MSSVTLFNIFRAIMLAALFLAALPAFSLSNEDYHLLRKESSEFDKSEVELSRAYSLKMHGLGTPQEKLRERMSQREWLKQRNGSVANVDFTDNAAREGAITFLTSANIERAKVLHKREQPAPDTEDAAPSLPVSGVTREETVLDATESLQTVERQRSAEFSEPPSVAEQTHGRRANLGNEPSASADRKKDVTHDSAPHKTTTGAPGWEFLAARVKVVVASFMQPSAVYLLLSSAPRRPSRVRD